MPNISIDSMMALIKAKRREEEKNIIRMIRCNPRTDLLQLITRHILQDTDVSRSEKLTQSNVSFFVKLKKTL